MGGVFTDPLRHGRQRNKKLESVVRLLTYFMFMLHRLQRLYSFILRVLEYCDTVWTCCGKVNANSLEKLQKKVARIILKTSNSEQAMSSLVFDLLADRRDRQVLRFIRKYIESKVPQFFLNYFTSNCNISKRNIRQQHHLHFPRLRTEYGKNSLQYHGCVIFNNFQTISSYTLYFSILTF